MTDRPQTHSFVDSLEAKLGASWKSIRAARAASMHRRNELETQFSGLGSSDTTLVIFGSVAREELTSGSDLDWILLIDGQSVPEHKDQERRIKSQLEALKLVPPGPSGIFGGMVGSHDLVHTIESAIKSSSAISAMIAASSIARASFESPASC